MRFVSAALRRFRQPLEIGVFVQVPAIVVLWLVWFVYGHGGGGDFAIFRRAGRAVLHGHSAYVRPTLKLLAANDRFVQTVRRGSLRPLPEGLAGLARSGADAPARPV
jgi:hypothetical protein